MLARSFSGFCEAMGPPRALSARAEASPTHSSVSTPIRLVSERSQCPCTPSIKGARLVVAVLERRLPDRDFAIWDDCWNDPIAHYGVPSRNEAFGEALLIVGCSTSDTR
jgi:hypothetical protein